MSKMKFYTLTYDNIVKVIMVICILIAASVISFSIYYILIKAKKENIYIKDFFEVSNYEAGYNLTVYSNKNCNTYHIYEIADMVNNKYLYLTSNGLEIKVDINDNVKDVTISKENMEYEYSDINVLENNEKENFVSFSSVIKIVKDIKENKRKGYINQIEENGKIIYEINLEEEVFNGIKNIKVEIDKYDNCIHFVTMCDNERNTIYFVDFQDFIVKNSH